MIRHRGVGVMSRQRAQYLRRAIPRARAKRLEHGSRGTITIPVPNEAFAYEAAGVLYARYSALFPGYRIHLEYR